MTQQYPTHLLCQSLHGSDVDTAPLRVLQEHPQDGKLRTDGLPAARGCPHEHIVITVVDGVEHWKVAEQQWEHQGEKRLGPLLRTKDTQRNSASQSSSANNEEGGIRALTAASLVHLSPRPPKHGGRAQDQEAAQQGDLQDGREK